MFGPTRNRTEKQQKLVDEFCSVCDRYKKHCTVNHGGDNQLRYARRDWCGWAIVKGRMANITMETVEYHNTGEEIPRNELEVKSATR